jgi:hypothetical protein
VLPACLAVLSLLQPGWAQSPAAVVKAAPTAPGSTKVNGRYDNVFGDERVNLVAAPDAPAIPDAFQARTEPCFQASQQRQPSKSGRVDLQVKMAAGALTDATVVSSTLGDVLLSECLVERAQGLTLAGLPDGTWTWGLVVGAAVTGATP